MNARTLPYIAGHYGRVTRERIQWHGPGRLLGRIPAWLKLWHERYRQRETLTRLNDRLLVDVGLQRDDVMQAVREPFWRL